MKPTLAAAAAALAMPALLFATANVAAAQSGGGDFAGLVDIGGGRKMYLECRGTGSPTVILISGKGNGAADWNEILDPADPIRKAPADLLAGGQGKLVTSDSAVMPSVSRFTRVCAYDRPGTRLSEADLSTPVPQPHTADRAVEDLHALLTAASEAGPFVLAAHSYGGVIAMLYARTYPADVAGLVMIDAATQLMQKVASPKALAAWDAGNKVSVPEAPEAVQLLDAFAKIEAAPRARALPAIVLSADKPWPGATPSAPAEGEAVTFADWLASGDLLAKSLDAPHVTRTDSGHNIYQYAPQLVVDAIREVVDEIRSSASDNDADIDEDFSIISGLSGGPTSYLDGITQIPWVLKLVDKCDLDEERIRGSAASAMARTKLGFVTTDSSDFFERPLFQLVVTALPAGSGCAASMSARVSAPVEGARFVHDKKRLQQPSFVTIWEDEYGESGRTIYEPRERINAEIEATLDTLITEFAEAWTHSQGIGHPKYGAP